MGRQLGFTPRNLQARAAAPSNLLAQMQRHRWLIEHSTPAEIPDPTLGFTLASCALDGYDAMTVPNCTNCNTSCMAKLRPTAWTASHTPSLLHAAPAQQNAATATTHAMVSMLMTTCDVVWNTTPEPCLIRSEGSSEAMSSDVAPDAGVHVPGMLADLAAFVLTCFVRCYLPIAATCATPHGNTASVCTLHTSMHRWCTTCCEAKEGRA